MALVTMPSFHCTALLVGSREPTIGEIESHARQADVSSESTIQNRAQILNCRIRIVEQWLAASLATLLESV